MPGIVRDVSDRAAPDEQLREREDQYRSIFESTTDGLIIRDLNGHIVEVNPAACRIYGYGRKEMLGLHVRTLIDPDDHHLILENQQNIEAGRPFQSRAVHLQKDGTRFHVEAHGAAFVFKGRPHVLTVVHDVTESVEAERAVREERQRLSRELHDSVTQALFSMTLQARACQMMLERAGIDAHDPLAQRIEQLTDLAQGALAEMRALIFELRPEALEEEGLIGALQRHIAAFKARNELEVESVLSDEPAVSLSAKEALYRIAQEAMQNAVKHAQPERLELYLETSDTAVTLEVRDNGQGFDPGASFPGHLGLKSMRERAERAGGSLWLESQPGLGTCIRVTVPIPVVNTAC